MRRQAGAYARVLGGAMTHDAYHVTLVDPARTQVDACVHAALDAAAPGS